MAKKEAFDVSKEPVYRDKLYERALKSIIIIGLAGSSNNASDRNLYNGIIRLLAGELVTKIATKVAGMYKELRSILDEAKAAGMGEYESYKSLVRVLNELAAALHAMLYLDKRLDPEEEQAVRDALSTVRIL